MTETTATTDDIVSLETDQTPLQIIGGEQYIQPEIQVDESSDCQVLRLSYPPKCVDIGIATTFFNDEGLPTSPIEPGQ